jgi:hypothetical protein
MGVRQGENLSPFLFAVFLNDLEQFMEDKNITGLESIYNATLQILSNAFSKSTNAQYIFFLFFFIISKKA